MKKLFSTLFLLLVLVTPTYAQTERATPLLTGQSTANGSSSAKQAIKAQADQTKIIDLKQRAKTEITRRISFLNDLATKITNLKKISDADKTTLKTQIQQQVDGLTTLLAKIDADTDLITLRTDVKSIVNGYYIFAFFRVKINLLVAAESLSVTTENLNLVYAKLLVRVTDQKNQGKDTVSLETALTDMLAKINDSKTQYQAAETELNTLAAQSYPGNKTSLNDARSKIKLGAQDLKTAHLDGEKVRQGLRDVSGNLKPKTGTSSALRITPSQE